MELDRIPSVFFVILQNVLCTVCWKIDMFSCTGPPSLMEFNSIDKYVKRSWVNFDFWPGHIPCGLSLDLTLVFHDDIFWYHFSKTNNLDSCPPWWLPNLLQTALVLMRYCRDWLLMGQDLLDWDTEINIFSEGVSGMSGFITEMTRMTDTYYRSIHQCACHS